MTPPPSPEPVRRGYRRYLIALIAVLAIAGLATPLVRNLAMDLPRSGAAVVFHIESRPRALLPLREHPSATEFESYAQTQEGLVRSRRVINAALSKPEVRVLDLIREASPDPVAWLEANLRVTLSPSKNYLRVELDGEDTSEVIVLLTALSHAYLSESHARDRNACIQHLSELDRTYQEYLQETTRVQAMISAMEELSGGRQVHSFLLHIRSPEEFARESKEASDELRRVRLERAILKACPPPVIEQSQTSQWVAVGGGASLAILNLKSPRATSIEKELAVREQFWTNEFRSAEARLEKYASQRHEVEKLRRGIADKEELTKRIAAEIERCKFDLRAPPRVSMADEPHPLPRLR